MINNFTYIFQLCYQRYLPSWCKNNCNSSVNILIITEETIMSASLESSPILTRKNIQSVNTDEIYKKAKHTISAGNISFSSIYPIHTLDFYLGVYTRYFYYKYSHFSFDINMCSLLLKILVKHLECFINNWTLVTATKDDIFKKRTFILHN